MRDEIPSVWSSNYKGPSFNPFYARDPSPTLEMNQKMAQLEGMGKDICRLGFGGSPLPIPDILKQALIDHAEQSAYPEIQGLSETRIAISRFYQSLFQYTFSPDQILIYPGSKEAIFQILNVLDGPVLIPQASWVSYEPQAKMAGKEVFWLKSNYKSKWKLSADALEQGVANFPKEAQKILILNSPSNPAGQIYSKDELISLTNICRKNKILVIFDGIYGTPNDYRGNSYECLVQVYPEGTIFTGGLSKIFSAGGWRFGFAVLPTGNQYDSLKKALIFRQSESLSGVCHPVQLAAMTLYQNLHSCESYIRNYHLIFQEITEYMHQRLCKLGIQCHPAVGGYYLFPEFHSYRETLRRKRIFNSRDLAQKLIQIGVCTLPGECFGVGGERYALRLACVDFDGTRMLNNILQNEKSGNLKAGADELMEFAPRLKLALERIEIFFGELDS